MPLLTTLLPVGLKLLGGLFGGNKTESVNNEQKGTNQTAGLGNFINSIFGSVAKNPEVLSSIAGLIA